MSYSWFEDYLTRLDGKEARQQYYERRFATWNEAARKMAEALVESQRALSSISVETQERQAELAQSFFESVVSNLRDQVESNAAGSRELAEQVYKSQETGWLLAQESMKAQVDFLDSIFSYYQENLKAAQRATRRS
ncbi:MAG TPA: hypothetical protein VEY13_14540 [Rubrobacteraceae bacterium]|nr:hypothetical protein [Rubrobacteraceae bacterium]